MHILLVDQKRRAGELEAALFRKNRILTDFAGSTATALEYCLEENFQVILLAESVSPGDKKDFVRELRDRKVYTPVMLFTKNEEERIAGLRAGADDCMTMPFSREELLARIEALARRSEVFVENRITVGNTTLDCRNYGLESGEVHVSLTNKEFLLVELFMKHPQTIFSNDVLFHNIWEVESETNIDVIRTYIGYLRRILEKLDSDLLIHTVRNVGYMMTVREKNCVRNEVLP